MTEQTAEQIRELNRIQAARQVPAGDREALYAYKQDNPWADITAPVLVDPYQSPEEIERENEARRRAVGLPGRMAHGEGIER